MYIMFNNNKYIKSDYILIFNYCVKYCKLILIIIVYNILLIVMFIIWECGKFKNDIFS